MKKTSTIGVSILLICTALGKIFISYQKEKIKTDNEELMTGIRNNLLTTKYNAEVAIDSLLKAQGRIFLYSNDTSAKLGWVPNISGSSIGNIKSMVAEAYNYDDFVKNKDSLGFLLLLNYKGKDIYTLNKNILFNKANTGKRLWFLGVDSKNKLPKDSVMSKRYPEIYDKAFAAGWGIGFNDVSDVNPDGLMNLYSLNCIRYLNQIDGFNFYMVGYENDNNKPGVDSLGFIGTIRVLNKLLKNNSIDTTKFNIKTFLR